MGKENNGVLNLIQQKVLYPLYAIIIYIVLAAIKYWIITFMILFFIALYNGGEFSSAMKATER